MLEEILKNIEVFSALDSASLSTVAARMKQIQLKAGDVICNEGEPGHSMFVLESGELSVQKRGKDKTLVEIARLRPGEVAGIMSLFGDESRSATLISTGEARLWEISNEDFQALVQSTPQIAHQLLKVLSRYLREETRIVAELRTRDVENRLKIAFFDSKPYTEEAFKDKNEDKYALQFFESR
ncbi:MAG TPA: cyclic nucleotide-binding domain-containing protein, partial [Leptospiraceae bacterium]|nr:cyclic nucleotide-binding domain-containing protein [Leptospiraceae bacterium]